MRATKEIMADIERLLNGGERAEIDINDKSVKDLVDELNRAKTRLELTQNGIAVDFPSGGATVLKVYRIGTKAQAAAPKAPEKAAVTPTAKVAKASGGQHTYVPPAMAKDLLSLLADEKSHIPFIDGPTQCGKSTLVKYLAAVRGNKMYRVNCRGDVGSEFFFGEQTIVVDQASKQNMVVFKRGVIEKAMVEGLDEAGNEVGPAALLFVDEITACPAHIAHGLNLLFEGDDARRTLVLAEDGGRVVRSHSGFRIVCAGNTAGRGATGLNAGMYTAQTDALDISLLNRMSGFFRMGYDRGVEKRVLLEKVGDDKVVKTVLSYRDAVRQAIREGKLTSPFSTAHLVHIADLYRVYGNLGKAIYYVMMEYVLPEERAFYNEQAVLLLGVDILKQFEQGDVDFM